MANWISSKLRVAESLLQQIDQQAAESLGKVDGPRSPSSNVLEEIPKKADPSPPLKYQLPKKSSPPSPRSSPSSLPANGPAAASLPSPAVSGTSAADDDWTELLSSAEPASPRPRPSGSSRKAPSRGSARRGSGAAVKAARGVDVAAKSEVVDNASGDAERSASSGPKPSRRSSSILDLTKELFKQELQGGGGDPVRSRQSGADFGVLDPKKSVDVGDGSNKGSVVDSRGTGIATISSGSKNEPKSISKSPSESDDESSDSTSTSDSDDEVRQRREERRRRKEQMMAEKMAAFAAAAIRERENAVAKLEGEKQSLEKILQERQMKQAQEASELQTSMFQTMEAVDKEKQKHNSTMMEALARLAELETANAELAKSLAIVQMNLETEVYRVGKLRQQVELKEVALEDHRRKILKIQQSSPSLDEVESLKSSQIKQEILDAEYSFVHDKLLQLKDKAKKLEENLEITRRDISQPTEVEIELKKRLDQLTDRLIQKQAQVEALSSEKATLVLRIETVTRLLDEDGLSIDYAENPGFAGSFETVDLEYGAQQPSSSSSLQPVIRDRIRTGQQHFGSVLRQLDFVFSIGVIYLRRNKKAQVWALLYLLCLHFWVIYILNSNSHVSSTSKSGAVYSLETINNITSNP